MDRDLMTLGTFLQTIEHGEKPDDLGDVAGLARWARTTGDAAGPATAADLARARKLRDALAGILRDPTAPTSRGRLADAARPFPLLAGDPTTGQPALVPVGSGVHAALGRVVAAAAGARATGAIDRLKLCDGCGFAFIDQSKNRSRRWCLMTACGNQSKVRAYRRRRRSAAVASEAGPRSAAAPTVADGGRAR